MARKKKDRETVADKVDLSRKKVKEFDIDNNLKVAYKTGKIIIGKNQVLKYLRQKSFKMIILSNNCPWELEMALNHFNTLSKNKVYIHRYKGSSWDLGLACAKPYMISILGVIDYGDSQLSTLIAK
jgi:large subunit ribosomal protein L30e